MLDVNSGLVWGVDIFIVVQPCSTIFGMVEIINIFGMVKHAKTTSQ